MRNAIISMLFSAVFAIGAPTMAEDEDACTEETSETEAVVRAFFDEAFVRGNYTDAIMRFIREDYIQHNPMAPDGREAILNFFGSIPDEGKPKVTLARVIAQCDIAAVHYKTEFPGMAPWAVVDIFRVEDGMIAEHWDVVQPIPDQSANPHPMF